MKITKHDQPIVMPRHKKAKSENNRSINSQARAAGLTPVVVHSRLHYGWTLEAALKTPVMTREESARKAGVASRRAARAQKANKTNATETSYD